MARTTIYISVDIEADGPIPGPYSMLSIGAAVAGRHDQEGFAPVDPESRTFYRELRPISDDHVPEALAVSGLDRERLAEHGADPAAAMREFSRWVTETADGAVPVFVSYPAGFDWMFTCWYLVRFTGANPFGHSRCLDLKTFFAARADTPVNTVAKRRMPREVLSERPHTHNALDDAMEQADLFANLMRWRP